jgi:hypothetical protein
VVDRYTIAERVQQVQPVAGLVVVSALGIARDEKELVGQRIGVGVERAEYLLAPDAVAKLVQAAESSRSHVGRQAGHGLGRAFAAVEVDQQHLPHAQRFVPAADAYRFARVAGQLPCLPEHAAVCDVRVTTELLPQTWNRVGRQGEEPRRFARRDHTNHQAILA